MSTRSEYLLNAAMTFHTESPETGNVPDTFRDIDEAIVSMSRVLLFEAHEQMKVPITSRFQLSVTELFVCILAHRIDPHSKADPITTST